MVYRQLLRYISAGRIADDVRTIGSDQVKQGQGIGDQQRERKFIRRLRDLGIAMTSQVKSHDPITTRQRRHPLKPALRIAHCRVQEKNSVGLTPRVGKVVDVISKLKSVRRAEGAIHFFWSLAREFFGRLAIDDWNHDRSGFDASRVILPVKNGLIVMRHST